VIKEMQKNIKVLCFANLSEKIGERTVEIPIETEMKVYQLREQMIQLYPQCQQILRSCMIAINQTYSVEEDMIAANDEVAFIPPVSGG
jgi:molybdopterin converting factor subunit 1